MEAPAACALCNSLGSIDGNFIPNTDGAKKDHARIHFTQSEALDDRIVEDEILQRCFPNCQPKVERSASKRECQQSAQQSLVNLCRSLLKDQPKSSLAVCNMCGTGVSLKKSPSSMVRHARAHLEYKVFVCRHCDHSMNSSDGIRGHIRQIHGVLWPSNADFDDKTVEHLEEISKQIERCFSSNYPRAAELERQFVLRGGCRDKSQRSIAQFCRSIFLQRSKPAHLECNLCGLRIALRANRFVANSIYQHAAAHLEVKLFTCRHCNQSVSTKCAMRIHLRGCHQIIDGNNNDDFEDQSEKFHSEYLNMIERCFSAQVKLEGPPPKGKNAIHSEAGILSRPNLSKLAIKRHLFCNRLIMKIIDGDEKIRCSLCSKRFGVKHSGCVVTKKAFSHAETHLQKPLYRCKVCGSSFSPHTAITKHLRTKHGLGMEKNHECVADEFHEEIMATFSKCYGAECV